MIGPRRPEIGTVPDGVFESRMTCAASGARRSASASAQNRSRARTLTPSRSVPSADPEDPELDRACRDGELHGLAGAVTDERLAHRRLVADAALARRGLGGADDDVLLAVAVGLDDDLAPDLHLLVVAALDDDGLLEHLLEREDAALEEGLVVLG